ncbi:class Ib ribonucleoside-diphosphate reductase assembly flavoprotein NrdI, partial [Streptococcus pyogenes]
MPQITLVFISLSGNTLSFVKRLSLYLADNYDYHVKQINIKD